MGFWKGRSPLAARHSPADYLASGVVLAPLEQMGQGLASAPKLLKEYTDE